MKVAFVIGGLPFGGIEVQLLEMASYMIRKGDIKPVVINISGTGMLMKDFQEAGIELINIFDDTDSLKTFKIGTLLALRKVFKEVNPDIIHTAHFSANYFARLASIGLGKPMVTHIHNIKSEKKAYRRVADKFLSKYTTQYLAVSEMVKEYVEREHSSAKIPCKVLYNFFDVSKLNFEKLDKSEYAPANSKVIVSTGRLVLQKNVDKIIKSMPFVLQEYPDAHLLIVGDGNLSDELKHLSSSLHLDGHVTFTGYRKDVMALLDISDIFVMPSEYEGFGNSHLEAMFMGLPAVISENVPTKEFASKAVVVCDTTPKSIAQGLLSILKDEKLYAEMSKKAKEVSKSFSLDSYINSMMDIYKEAAELNRK